MASQPSSQPPSTNNSDQDGTQDIEQGLTEVEKSLIDLKARLTQIQWDEQRKIELKNRIDEVIPQIRQTKSQQLKEELNQLKTQLETLEFDLESRLVTWGSFQEPFWQAVRFGGLGIVIGWLLKSCSGG
jgi:O6-methylguanine-DNA--protein-cysteine methyltransferase